MPEAVIVSAARSPIGRAFKGSLASIRPDDLTAQLVRAALDQVPQLDPNTIDDLMLGCGLPGGEQGFNMARVVSVLLGYDSLPGTTVTRYCSSSLQTTRMALHAIKAGEGDVFVSAGVETVSRFTKGNSDSLPDTHNPLFAEAGLRTKQVAETGADSWTDPREAGLVPDAYISMGQTAENVALAKGVTREEMDRFGVRSQNLAEKAIADGFFAREITPVTLPDGTVVSTDDGPRAGVDYEGVSQLKPVFRPDGRITAGNCCPLNDGAAALVIMSDTRAAELGITPLARVVSTGVSALSSEIMGLGPVEASKQALARAGMTIDDIDLVEINEAFAAQVIPSARDLGIDEDKLNVNGGAIALGHPFGMTGARITTTLLNGLRTHDKQFGLETMCVGGGSVRPGGSFLAQVAQQAQDLDVQPDQRGHQAERDVPGQLRRGTGPNGLVRHVEVEQQAERRHADHDQAERDGQPAAVPQPQVHPEQSGDQVRDHQDDDADHRAHQPLGEPRGDPHGAGLVDHQHADEHPGRTDDRLSRDARVDLVEDPADAAEGHTHRGGVGEHQSGVAALLEDHDQRHDEADDERRQHERVEPTDRGEHAGHERDTGGDRGLRDDVVDGDRALAGTGAPIVDLRCLGVRVGGRATHRAALAVEAGMSAALPAGQVAERRVAAGAHLFLLGSV
jgi:acetyl-CoA C-acetyltransferase